MIDHNAFFDEMNKIADAVQEVEEHPALTAAKGIGGLALGAGAGYMGAHGLNKALKAAGGQGLTQKHLRYVGPAVGAGAGLGYGLLQHRMMERIKHNLDKRKKGRDDGVAEGIAD